MHSKHLLRHPLIASVILAAAVCAVIAGVERAGLLEPVELQGYDLLMATRGFGPAPEPVIVVDFDDATMQQLGAFPIPRAVLAEVMDKVSSGQPELIGLDIMLTERRVAADDAKLQAAIAQAGNVVLVNSFGDEQLPPNEPLPDFRAAALDVAFANLPLDSDGSIRRALIAQKTEKIQGVSLAVALAQNFLQQPLAPGRAGTVRIGSQEVALAGPQASTALIGAWLRPGPHVVAVNRLLERDFDPGIFKGKVVFLGQTSDVGKDLYPTPAFRFRLPEAGRRQLSGVEIHAAAFASLISGQTIRPMGDGWRWQLSFVLVWIMIAAVVVTRPSYAVAGAAVMLIGVYTLAQALFSGQTVWLKFLSTEAGVLLALPAGFAYRFVEERRLKAGIEAERHQLMSLFERYVSPEVAAEIWTRRNEIALSGQERVATVMFSDIRNFTALTAGKPSTEVLAWLNNYFTAMSEVIKKHGGFLNKFIGDGLLVVFGVPVNHGPEQDACAAVRAALEMIERVEQLNADMRDGWPRIQIGVGLHTGPLTAGNVGSADRLEYSVIGETVNLASRLESLTKEFGVNLVLSPATTVLVRSQFATHGLGETSVRGFESKIEVYTANAIQHSLVL